VTGTRPDGIVSRTATAADAEEVLALIGARSGPEDVPEAEAAFIDGQDGFKRWLVAADGPRIVAVLALWEERVRVGETWLQAGQIDFVATASGYGRRGLMRGLIDEAHVRCAARGDALQIMLGIPYFYRQFGYSYTVPIPVTHEVPPDAKLEPPTDVLVRRATGDDLPALQALQEEAQRGADVAMPHSSHMWRWLMKAATVELRIAEEGGMPAGMSRLKRAPGAPDELVVAEVAAPTVEVARALLADARSLVGGSAISVVDRPAGALAHVLAEVGRHSYGGGADEYLIRVADPVVLLDALRPTLSARLNASAFGRGSGELLVSFYRRSAVLRYEGGAVTHVAAAPGEQAPVSEGGAGVPPDLVADLVFGPHGALELEATHADLNLGRQRALMETLFPPLRADILVFYID